MPDVPEVVLVLNTGLDYIEFELFRMAREQRMLASGSVEHIGAADARLTYRRYDGYETRDGLDGVDLRGALEKIRDRLSGSDFGVLASIRELEAVGHRVVHGGEEFQAACRVTPAVIDGIGRCAPLAPLHNPANIAGILAAAEVFPDVPAVAVFDTTFHQSMAPSSYLYAIPFENYQEHGVRKYGFHGNSHQSVAEGAAALLKRPVSDVKLITCHLGRGCSVCAVDRGHVLDNSMGMTPLPGLVMSTRCGDIDPAVVLYLARQGMSADEIDILLNRRSGLLGVAGIGSGDIDAVIHASQGNNEQATRAVWMYVFRVVSYIGAYYTLLDGADALVFTGRVGVNSPYIRSRVIGHLGVLGCHLDETKNHAVGRTETISDARSRMRALVIPTNEELVIARQVCQVLGAAPGGEERSA